jgi:hypothetical protein
MSFKKKSKQMTFADLEVLHNPSFTNKRLKRLSEIQKTFEQLSRQTRVLLQK